MEEKKLLFILVALTSFFLSLPLYAQDGINEIQAWVDKVQDRGKAYLQEAKQLKEGVETEVLKLIQAKKLEEKSCSQEIEPEQSQKTEPQNKPAILIFVSLSMPETSLKNLYKEAKDKDLPLLIRGLKNNSFKETAQALSKLGIAVQIDPQLFEDFCVEVVPTFVRINNKEPLRLQGNVSLHYAQQKLEASL